ncbi:Smad nuclear-interacting protein 1, partial [Podochytrium sp. JEL0797]
DDSDAPPPKPKEAPNFGVSGALTAEANTFKGVVLKYAEPQEARKPPSNTLRLYCFKGKDEVDMLHVARQSAYLFGRDAKVADVPVLHPSISKQHAVLQYRLVNQRVKPYLIDLDSANGTFLNSQKIEGSRYYELKPSDVIKFGFSSRDYVLMDENEVAD